ncbi:hypothetical protein D8N35_17310 [Enterococcus casseliflavus]|nr:hypothetical protein D8N35_17310 [Enterococcus casseliflavus]
MHSCYRSFDNSYFLNTLNTNNDFKNIRKLQPIKILINKINTNAMGDVPTKTHKNNVMRDSITLIQKFAIKSFIEFMKIDLAESLKRAIYPYVYWLLNKRIRPTMDTPINPMTFFCSE